MDFVVEMYKVTQPFPKDESFGLTQQIRRSAVSIPSNIAEGCGRNTAKDMDHFLSIAQGSSFELETQLIVARNLNYLSLEKFDLLADELTQIQKMLYNLKCSLAPALKV